MGSVGQIYPEWEEVFSALYLVPLIEFCLLLQCTALPRMLTETENESIKNF